MANKPLILALANPDPEIMPEVAKSARPDAIIATGRSDYVNQVNNVLCFPFVFRGALDVDATTINEAMKVAAVEAIAALARVEASDVVANAYGGAMTGFGPDYIIPKPFDPRLILHIAPAVARAAMESGVARRPIADFDAYEHELEKFVYRSGQLMRPVFDIARQNPRRVVYAEGEEERVLRAVQTVVDEGLAHPILIGRRDVILEKTRQLGLRLDFNKQARILDPVVDKEFFAPLTERYQRMVERRGVQPESAARWLATRHGIAAAMLLDAGEVDAALCGGLGDWTRQLSNILPIIPRQHGVTRLYSLSALILPNGALFFCDTHVNVDPTAEQIAEMTMLAARSVRRFGLAPKAALLVAFQLRHLAVAQRHQDAQGPWVAARGQARFRIGWGDACRCGPERKSALARGLLEPPHRFGKPAGDADPGCRQYRAYPALGRDRSTCWLAPCCWACPSRCM